MDQIVGDLENLKIDKEQKYETESYYNGYKCTLIEHKYPIGIICRNCFAANKIRINNKLCIDRHNEICISTNITNNKIDSIVSYCSKCNVTSDKFITDSNFIKAIKTFINKGYKIIDVSNDISITKPYRIVFNDSSLVSYIDTLPITWSYYIKNNTLELDYSNYIEGILDINNWVKNL